LQGSEAMHAWVLLWCGGGAGWVGLDPTNGILAAEDHVTLAIGRDYTDVAPVDGVILGSGRQRMGVSVNVTLLFVGSGALMLVAGLAAAASRTVRSI